MATGDDYILVVDDMNFMRLLLGKILNTYGHSVRTAPDGNTALHTIATRAPKLVFLDLNLPGNSGIEICQAVRRTPGLEKLPVIICTANTSREMVEQSIAAGATDFLCKPVTAANVGERLIKHLGANAAPGYTPQA